jgi:hypothetical protein
MAQEKGSIGFQTPSREIVDAFAVVHTELSKKKTDWESVGINLRKAGTSISNSLESDQTNPPLIKTMIMLLMASNSMLVQIGLDLTETHTRLAQCEKAICELKLRN